MGQQIITEDGRVLERVGGRMIDVTPSEEALAAQEMGVVDALAESFKGAVANVGRSAMDLALGMPFLAVNPETGENPLAPLSKPDRVKMQANIREASTQEAVRLEAVAKAHPVASFVGQAGAEAPLFLGGGPIGGGIRGAARLAAREGAIGGGAAFAARPGSISERLQNAALGAALGGTGAVGFRAGAQVVGSTSNAFKRYGQTGEFSGEAAITLGRSPIDFEIATGNPRLGPELQKEYDRIASRAVVKRSSDAPGDQRAVEGVNDFEASLLTEMDNLGLASTRGDRTGNRRVKQVEDGLANNVLTSRPWQQLAEFNERRLSDITLDRLGLEPGKGTITGGDLGRARVQIANGLKEIEQRIGLVDLDDTFARAMNEIGLQNRKGVGRSKGVARFIRELRDLSGVDKAAREAAAEAGEDAGFGSLTGQWFMDTRSALTNELRRAARASDGNTVDGVWKMVDQMDAVLKRSNLPDQVKLDYDLLRDQWRIETALEQGKALTGGSVNPVTADTVLKKMYPHEYLRTEITGDPFMDAVKALAHFDRPMNSLTAARQSVNDLVSGNIKSGAIKFASGVTVGNIAFRGSQGRTGSALFEGGLIADPSRSAARLGTIAGVAAASEQGQQ